LLPVAPIWRWTRRTGGAWCSALQVVADGWRLGLRPSDDGVAVFVETVFVGCDRALQIPPVGDFRLAIRRLLRRVCESRDDDRPAPRAREVPLVDGSSTWVELEGDYEVIRLLAEATICDLTLPGWA
jgi:hypothetical protein